MTLVAAAFSASPVMAVVALTLTAVAAGLVLRGLWYWLDF